MEAKRFEVFELAVIWPKYSQNILTAIFVRQSQCSKVKITNYFLGLSKGIWYLEFSITI